MSLARRYATIDEPAAKPAARPAVSPALVASIDRVEPEAVKQAPLNIDAPVKQVVLNSEPSVKRAAKPSTPGNVTVRSSPEAFRAYHRESMRRRRAAAKVDSFTLAPA